MIRAPISLHVAWASFVLSLLAPAPRLRAQDLPADSWIGKKVITALHVELRVGDEVVDERGAHHTFTVTRALNGWLWLESKDQPEVKGYALPKEVVPYEDAIDYYTREIQADPRNAEAYSLRAEHWKRDRKELDLALGDYSEAIRLRPDWAFNWSARGNCWQAKKEYDKAIADDSECIRLGPTDAIAYSNRGSVWGMKGDHDKAITDFIEAIRLDPKDESAYYNRGIAWKMKQDYDKAIADFNEAIRLDPKNASAYNNRGIAWKMKQDHDKAIADFNQAIRLDPKDASAYNNRGNAWADKNDHDKAIADYNEAIRLDPKDTSAYNNRGNAWEKKQDYGKAIADFNEAIRLDPKDAIAYYNRGAAWADKKIPGKAIADFSEAIRLDPKDPGPRIACAWIWATCPDAMCRDGRKAVEWATKACEMSGWKEAPFVATLAAACAEVGDFAAAVKWQNKAIELSRDDEQEAEFRSRLKLFQEKKPIREADPEAYLTST